MQVACSFPTPARVHAVGMSPLASSHCLVAVGSADSDVSVRGRGGAGRRGALGLEGLPHAPFLPLASPTHPTPLLTHTRARQVVLCDITTGAFTHTLSAHSGAVWALHWSLRSEWQLLTGGWLGGRVGQEL